MGRGETRRWPIELSDLGGGAEPWSATVEGAGADATVSVPATIVAPGTLTVDVTVGATAADADLTGAIVLTRGTATRRIPFWGRIRTAALAAAKHTALTEARRVLREYSRPRWPS